LVELESKAFIKAIFCVSKRWLQALGYYASNVIFKRVLNNKGTIIKEKLKKMSANKVNVM